MDLELKKKEKKKVSTNYLGETKEKKIKNEINAENLDI